MSFRRFIAPFLLAFVAVTMCVGVALASTPYVESGHMTRVGMKAFTTPDYTTAYFSRAFFEIYDAESSKTGTLTIKGGNYAWRSYVEGEGYTFDSVPAGRDKTFDLHYYENDDYYEPVDANNYTPSFRGGIDTGLSGIEFSFKVGSYSASGKMPKVRSLAKQLETYVPHVELIVEPDGMVTGFKWRFVDPKDQSKELVRNATTGIDLKWVSRISVRLWDNSSHYSVRQNAEFKDGDILSEATEIIFDTPVHLDNVRYVRVNFGDSEDRSGTNSRGYYSWEFMPHWDDEAPHLSLMHNSRTYMENWKTNHNYDDGSTVPHFFNIYPEISNMFDEKASVEIDFKNSVRAGFDHLVTWETVEEKDVNGKTTFPTYRWSDWPTHYLGNEGGAEGYFANGAETALSGQSFVTEIGGVKRSSKIDNILSTADQVANGCIPYLEFDEAEIAAGKITKATLRFVGSKSSTTAVTKDAEKRAIKGAISLQFRMKDRSRYTENINEQLAVGDLLDFTFDFKGREYKLDDIYQIRLWFSYDNYHDLPGIGSSTQYGWRFVIPGAVQDPLNPTTVPKPTVEELNSVASDLALDSAKIEAVDGGALCTRVSEFYNVQDIESMKEFDFSKTTAALLISQDIDQLGGAVVMGSGTFMPFNAKAFDEKTNMTIPGSFDKLKKDYKILKSFPGGGAIDLMDKYGEDLFEFTASGVVFKATLVVVDGVAPDSAVKPVNDSVCGVKLNSAKTILYIYDGEADGVAKDPISLTQKSGGGEGDEDEDGKGSGSSGGCSTAGVFLPFVLLAAVSMLKKRA